MSLLRPRNDPLTNEVPMYANPALIKKHEFKIRVDDPVEAKIIQLANGKQPAAYLRELIERALEQEEQRLNAIPKH